MKRTQIAGFGLGLALLAASGQALAQTNVDTVLTNGKILTVDATFAVVQALAIDRGPDRRARHRRRGGSLCRAEDQGYRRQRRDGNPGAH